MINFKDLHSFHFVSELDVLEVTSGSEVSLSITSADDAAVLLEGSYIPVDGTVRIYHLYKLLSLLIMESVATFVFTVGSESKTVHAVQSGVTVSESAMKFLPSFFLSTVMSERDTSVGRKELLSVLPIEPTLPPVTAVCSYRDGSRVVTASKAVAGTLTVGAVTELDVSAEQFVDTSIGTLVGYMVTCGERKMRYRVASLPTATTALLLRNAFGAWETLYFAGIDEQSPEFTRETAMVNGSLRLYNLEETASVRSYTGPLRPSGIALARDLARSRDVVLLERGVASDMVVITGVEVKHTSADDAIADFTYTWRRSSLLSEKLIPVRTPKLFDATFDETYN